MRVLVVGALLAMALYGTVAEAQTVAGRIQAVWDAEYGLYTYGPLYWDIEVAPSSAGPPTSSACRCTTTSAMPSCRRKLCAVQGERRSKSTPGRIRETISCP